MEEAYGAGRAEALPLYKQAGVQRANAQNEAAMLRQQLAAAWGGDERVKGGWGATSTTCAARSMGCCTCWLLTGRRASGNQSWLLLDKLPGASSTPC